MKAALFLGIVAFVTTSAAHPRETYDTKYDDFNAKELVGNVRLLRGYGKCFLSKAPCTAEGTELKKIVPEALKTQCAKCTTKQRELIKLVVHGFQEKLPEVWTELYNTYDPEDKYKKDFNDFINGSK